LTTNAFGTNISGTNLAPPPIPSLETATAQFTVNTNVPEETLQLRTDKAQYTFTSHGGGLKLVELLDYPETVSALRHKQPTTNQVAALNKSASVPTLAILGGEALQGDGIYKITKL